MDINEILSSKKAVVGIVGLGYVGLPILVGYLEKGFNVRGFDISKERINSIDNIEKLKKFFKINFSEKEFPEEIDENLYKVSEEETILQECDIIFICVPTPTYKINEKKHPNIAYVYAAFESIQKESLKNFEKERWVILTSTVNIGCTKFCKENFFNSEQLRDKVHLAFSSEREDPGNKDWNLKNTPRMVGVTELDNKEMDNFNKILEIISDEVRTFPFLDGSYDIASIVEASKLIENTFRYFNILFATYMANYISNEYKIPYTTVLSAASTKPYGFMPFTPSHCIGGHCIPEDPFFLNMRKNPLNKFNLISFMEDFESSFKKEIWDIIEFYLSLKSQYGNKEPKILVIGASYKPNTKDTRNSFILEVIKKYPMNTWYYDPNVPEISVDLEEPDGWGSTKFVVEGLEDNSFKIEDYDLVLINTLIRDPYLHAKIWNADSPTTTIFHLVFDPNELFKHKYREKMHLYLFGDSSIYMQMLNNSKDEI